MSSIFGGDEPEAPKEDPNVVRQRQIAEARAEAERIKSTQGQLKVETEKSQIAQMGASSLLGPLGTLTTRLGAG
jgi:hypothetical protein